MTPKPQLFLLLRSSFSTSNCWFVTRSASVFAWWSSCWSCRAGSWCYLEISKWSSSNPAAPWKSMEEHGKNMEKLESMSHYEPLIGSDPTLATSWCSSGLLPGTNWGGMRGLTAIPVTHVPLRNGEALERSQGMVVFIRNIPGQEVLIHLPSAFWSDKGWLPMKVRDFLIKDVFIISCPNLMTKGYLEIC